MAQGFLPISKEDLNKREIKQLESDFYKMVKMLKDNNNQ